ncbi:C4-dicarboxylate ABC transporter permease [Acuticoccus sediminis]|uniref:C4-dicarboxylate ABC transporter permease n=1 Tax=Acuticoccus sediminis TaxID=2184697 RepID=A0A8B2NVI4_9HYPH|nr:TRAP transporter fused permease subunit [Acuticoccus sediminis]RAI01763.1 C4-dicarboxylate ABC transporter permease [Acuticoccus sediminis]
MQRSNWLFNVYGSKRTLTGVPALAFNLVAIGFCAFYLYTSGFGIFSTESNRGIYLMLTSVLVFLIFPAGRWSPKTRPEILDLVFIVAAVVSLGYWIDQYVSYAIFRVSSPNAYDLWMGGVAIVVMLETSRRALGPVIPVIAILFLLQLYFGPWLPGRLSHPGMSVERILEFTFSTQEAMFGVVAATFATFVFPFIIFGAFLERSGAGAFFMELGTAVAGRWRGGPAKISVLTSALFGSISGSSVANVVTTGAFTIPLMKRTGFKPHHAGAIEAIASTGGQFMPPVMGAGVFILATLTETSYLTIALMNIIPATMFFVFVLMMVDLEAVRTGLKGLPPSETPSVRSVLAGGWYFFLPLVVVIGLLFNGYTPEFCAFWGTLATIALSWIRKDTRMGPSRIGQSLVGGAQSNAAAGAAIGSLGIIIGGIVLAGLGLKFSAVLVDFSGGYLFLALILVTLISIIIGMGSSTTGSYIILSVVAAPALIQLGVPTVAAHLAVFYAACLSNITPPVCVAAFAGAAIAGADPMKTGLAALKYGMTLILMPFTFAYVPGILLMGDTFDIVHSTIAYLLGVLALAVALQGADPIGGRIGPVRRGLFGMAGLILLFPASLMLDALGLAFLAAGLLPSVNAAFGVRRTNA